MQGVLTARFNVDHQPRLLSSAVPRLFQLRHASLVDLLLHPGTTCILENSIYHCIVYRESPAAVVEVRCREGAEEFLDAKILVAFRTFK